METLAGFGASGARPARVEPGAPLSTVPRAHHTKALEVCHAILYAT